MAIAMARAGRHGHPAPQPVGRRAGPPGRPGQAVGSGHGRPADHDRRRRTIGEVDELCGKFRISGVPVVDDDCKLLGIVTNRDMRFEDDPGRRVYDVMTPMPLVTGRPGISSEEALGCWPGTRSRSCRWSTTAGTPARPDHGEGLRQVRQVPAATKDAQGRLRVGAAVGFFGDAWQARDAARRGRRGRRSSSTPRTATPRRARHDRPAEGRAGDAEVDIIGGNVATRAGAQALVDAGADGGQGRGRARARSAPPGWSPVSACRRSPRSTRRRRACRPPGCR